MYERVIEDFHLLHPKLKERYHLTQESAFRGKGVMTEISGGSYWIRLLFKAGTVFRCFSRKRRNIPFTIENHIRLTKMIHRQPFGTGLSFFVINKGILMLS